MIQYQIKLILYGYPTGNHNVTAKINNFIKNMKYCVSDTVTFQSIDEHYSSTQASEVTGDLGRKHISQDTVSAMILLDRRKRGT